MLHLINMKILEIEIRSITLNFNQLDYINSLLSLMNLGYLQTSYS